MNQYAAHWLTEREREGSVLILPLNIKAVIARRATLEEWGTRDPKTSHIPIGVIAVEVEGEDKILAQNLASLASVATLLSLDELIASGSATAFLVEGHAKADGRPLCRLIGGDSVIADLPLLPIALAELVDG